MSQITVRLACPADRAALALMIDAMDAYYGDPERAAGETAKAVEGWLRGETSDTRFALAFAGDRPVGFACFAVLHPGNDLRGLLFLKDLFVAKDQRSQGIGEQLMRFLAGFCRQQGIGRIDWSTESGQAQRFYERLGARDMPQKRFMRLDGQGLADLAES